MNKKKILTTLSIAAVAIVSGYSGMKVYQLHADGFSKLMISEVEALADPELDIKPIEVHYANLHIKCYEVVKYGELYVTRENGLYSATCYVDTLSKKGYHEHECSSCSSY